MVAVLRDSKDYSLKRYVAFAEKMQAKAKVGWINRFSVNV